MFNPNSVFNYLSLEKDDLSGHFEPNLASLREMPPIAYEWFKHAAQGPQP